MAIGYFLRAGDKTTCGGQILTGDHTMQWYGVAGAREGDIVSCGKHSGKYHIIGGVSSMWLENRKHAGTLESISSCPCHSKFIPSIQDCYSNDEESISRAYSPPITQDKSIAPQQHFNSSQSTYSGYAIRECSNADERLSDGVYIWTERVEAGHSYISIHKNNYIHVFTYGRFGRTGTSGVAGDGILIYLQDEDARNYFRHELYKMNARVFSINDANINKTYQHFYSLWKNGTKPTWLPQNAGEATKNHGHVIDVYDLSSSNCTTHTVHGLKAGGSKIFNSSYTPIRTQYPIEREESFVIPLSLEDYLDSKKHDFSALAIIEMTDVFKEKYPNINSGKPIEKGVKQSGYEAGTQSLSTVGSSGISSEGSGGSFGSTFDTETPDES
ncbi:PAAR domain-containing protein [Moellerella wisconsensis]|uniref:PAAR domain-containing protein n=1 Tax=Moellerella wisconsensis TaxID=158849 RepID=UPI001F4E9046|nr:PAAR domain-containing protein [Moellerella wisconsensis]UNH23903.1 PAAR domain-containing protein [Moellerella wisconsensis]